MTRVLGVLVVAIAAAATIAGCALRWETEPPVWPSPAATTVERDRAAQAEQDVLDAADSSPLGQWQSTAAALRLEVWGEVYYAFPSPSPEPYLGDITEATIAARNVAITVADTSIHPTHRGLAISSSLAHALALWWSQAEPELAAGVQFEDVTVPQFPDLPWRDAVPIEQDLTDLSAALAALAKDADFTAYAYEVAAARAAAEQRPWLRERRAQLLEVAELWQSLSEHPDSRERVYALDTTALTGMATEATLRDMELGIAHTAAALAVENPDHHRWLTSIAMEHFQVALGATGGSWADIPALPGLDVTGPAD